jgi:hypothetical protein
MRDAKRYRMVKSDGLTERRSSNRESGIKPSVATNEIDSDHRITVPNGCEQSSNVVNMAKRVTAKSEVKIYIFYQRDKLGNVVDSKVLPSWLAPAHYLEILWSTSGDPIIFGEGLPGI